MDAQFELDSNTQRNYTPFEHFKPIAYLKVLLSLLTCFLYFGMVEFLQVFAFLYVRAYVPSLYCRGVVKNRPLTAHRIRPKGTLGYEAVQT